MDQRTSQSLTRKAIGVAAIAAGAMTLRALLRTEYSFRDKSVVITGGSRGLGLELARLFAAEGAKLTLIARTAGTLGKARAELQRLGAQVLTIPCDVRDRAQAEEAI